MSRNIVQCFYVLFWCVNQVVIALDVTLSLPIPPISHIEPYGVKVGRGFLKVSMG